METRNRKVSTRQRESGPDVWLMMSAESLPSPEEDPDERVLLLEAKASPPSLRLGKRYGAARGAAASAAPREHPV